MQPGVAGVENHLVVAPELAPGADVAKGGPDGLTEFADDTGSR
jgi:hypothetical protein